MNDFIYVGSIIPYSGYYANLRNVCPCDGRRLSISQYTALFSVIGITYGGDGRTYFNVPDLRGSFPIGAGNLPGSFDNCIMGQSVGTESVTLYGETMAPHVHGAAVSLDNPITVNIPAAAGTGTDTNDPTGKYWGVPGNISLSPVNVYSKEKSIAMNAGSVNAVVQDGGMSPGTVTVEVAGGGLSHNNMSPYTTINWLIVLEGLYPAFQ